MKELPLLIILILVAVSCSPSPKKEKKEEEQKLTTPYLVDIEKNFGNVQDLPVSLLTKDLEYIPLETKKNCLLRKVDKIMFTDSFIFVSDFIKLLQFDRKGKFIRQIGKNGKGPGEYIYVMAAGIDYYAKQIYIIDYVPRIEVFDFSGKYIRQFNSAKIISYQFLSFDKDKLIFHFGNMPKHYDSTEVSLMITDTNGRSLKEFKNYHKRKSKPGIMVANSPLYFYGKQFYFNEFLNDTLYIVDEKKLTPYAIIKLGARKMEPDPTLKDQKEIKALASKLWIEHIVENDSFLYLTLEFGFSDSVKFSVFNKKNGELTILKDQGFTNNMDGGIPFWPKYIFKDSLLVDYMNASDFLERVMTNDSQKLSPKLSRLTETIKEEDNPVIIVGKK